MSTVREAVTAYLKNKHVTLWADWNLTRPDSFDKAVDWLTEQVEMVNVQRLALDLQPETIVTESGRTITVSQPRLVVDPMYRVDL